MLVHSRRHPAGSPLHPFHRINARVEGAGRARGFTVTQSFPYFERRDPAELHISFADRHPNAAGHALLADAPYDGLATLPSSCAR